MKKILITGANGFLGSKIYKRLNNKYLILSPSHISMDIGDKGNVLRFVEEAKPDEIPFADTPRNLCMDTSKLRKNGINIQNMHDGYMDCLLVYSKLQHTNKADKKINGRRISLLGGHCLKNLKYEKPNLNVLVRRAKT